MSASPVLVLDIDGVVSLAQPGSSMPWYATLQEDWGLSHDDELAPEFFLKADFLEVLRGRLDLYTSGDPAQVGPVMRRLLGEELPVCASWR